MWDITPDNPKTLDEALEAGWFDGLEKFRHKETDGFLYFSSENIEEIIEYLRSEGITELSKNLWTFKKEGVWHHIWNYEFTFGRKKKRKTGKIKRSVRGETDKDHLNIKGQKNYGRWG